MSERLKQLMNKQGENYILPFLWLHGEDEQTLRTEVQKIYQCGIRAFCAESRPHPDFAGEKWWQDMDVLIDEAKRLGMKVWILDDSHFPTGPAVGHAATCDAENRKTILGHRWVDVCGPLDGASFLPPHEVQTDQIRYVIAGRLDKAEEFFDLTNRFINGRLYFDVPDGIWRIYYFYLNPDCIHSPHVNHLRKGGAGVLLDAVYEPHFAHYHAEFGKTVAGFFSDEPGFFACETGYDSYERRLGDEHLSLNWDTILESLLCTRLEKPIYEILPVLVDNNLSTAEKRAYYRHTYMDIITKLYDENFCSVLGDWCRAHGVEYMGHITEDNNTHCRTALSAGHFFRGMYGQDYSGADVVLHQILPGMEDINHAAFTGFYANSLSDGAFYSYSLYQMAVSLAQIDAKKKGRTMCELFGAYGWGMGIKMMKWMADFMLVRGVNRFVPHAFSPKDFPDEDCPPHFYAQGSNPQFECFGHLMGYMNRVAHLLDGGHHAAEIAVLYDGENEWSSDDILRTQKIGQVLTKAQLQYDIIPSDCLKAGEIKENKLILNTQKYAVVIVPYSYYITAETAEALKYLSESGIRILFAEKAPKQILEDGSAFTTTDSILSLSSLSEHCRKLTGSNIQISGCENSGDLRSYLYQHDDCTVVMLVNSHPSHTVSADISLPAEQNIYEYDAYSEKLYAEKHSFRLMLPAYESRILIITQQTLPASEKTEFPNQLSRKQLIWTVSICKQSEYPNFQTYETTDMLRNYNTPDLLPDFSGIIRYETEVEAEAELSGEISITGVSDNVQVFVNGQDMGMCIAPPYRLPIFLKAGKNKLVLETRTTLYPKIPDVFSRYLPMTASGITGNITISYYK